MKGSGTRIVLEAPNDILIEQALKSDFTSNNNHAEYEAFIADMILSLEIWASILEAKSDSLLVSNEVSVKYQAKELELIKYLQKLWNISSCFNRTHSSLTKLQSRPSVQAYHIEDNKV